MSHSRSHLAWTFLILLAFAAHGAWAAPAPETRSVNLFARLWETVVEIWAPTGYTMNKASAQEEAPAPAPTSDEGCMMDPHGGCKPGS